MFNILAIDGGGTRGIIPATLLDELFKDTGKTPTDIFDLLAGTSTGGILCTGYAAGVSTGEMLELYMKYSADIFYDTGFDDLRDGFGKNLGADYSNKRFKKILDKTFSGDRPSTLKGVRDRLREDQDLMVCTFHLNPVTAEGRPINFRPRIYHSNFVRDAPVLLRDLCLMTSAGPTYFPIYQNHIDGGVSLNNPSMAALSFAINSQNSDTPEYRHPNGKRKGMGQKMRNIQLLSLGCGTSNTNCISPEVIKRKKNGDWGNIQWIEYLPDLLTESNVQAADYYVSQLLPDDQLVRIQVYFDDPAAPEVLKRRTVGLDIKDKGLLNAMHTYAKKIYQDNREKLLGLVLKPTETET